MMAPAPELGGTSVETLDTARLAVRRLQFVPRNCVGRDLECRGGIAALREHPSAHRNTTHPHVEIEALQDLSCERERYGLRNRRRTRELRWRRTFPGTTPKKGLSAAELRPFFPAASDR
jgi:hypothetical protein